LKTAGLVKLRRGIAALIRGLLWAVYAFDMVHPKPDAAPY